MLGVANGGFWGFPRMLLPVRKSCGGKIRFDYRFLVEGKFNFENFGWAIVGGIPGEFFWAAIYAGKGCGVISYYY